jgi:hypothetical protein
MRPPKAEHARSFYPVTAVPIREYVSVEFIIDHCGAE